MRPATFAYWTNQNSFVHRLNARVKLLLLVAFVISVALLRSPTHWQLLTCLLYLIVTAWAARLPVLRILRMSLWVVPFVGFFSFIVYVTGDVRRAWFILSKSYLSALSVLICVSATPMPRLLRAAEFFRVPSLLLETTQLVYRYLFVLAEQAHLMQVAFRSRGGRPGARAFLAGSGMVAVLFTKSYEKAVLVHQAMCGRGFSGSLPRYQLAAPKVPELAIGASALLLITAVHFL